MISFLFVLLQVYALTLEELKEMREMRVGVRRSFLSAKEEFERGKKRELAEITRQIAKFDTDCEKMVKHR